MPGEVSIVGFDDIPEAQFFTPPLTTMHQDFKRSAAGACLLLARSPRPSARRRAWSCRPSLEDPREHRAAFAGPAAERAGEPEPARARPGPWRSRPGERGAQLREVSAGGDEPESLFGVSGGVLRGVDADAGRRSGRARRSGIGSARSPRAPAGARAVGVGADGRRSGRGRTGRCRSRPSPGVAAISSTAVERRPRLDHHEAQRLPPSRSPRSDARWSARPAARSGTLRGRARRLRAVVDHRDDHAERAARSSAWPMIQGSLRATRTSGAAPPTWMACTMAAIPVGSTTPCSLGRPRRSRRPRAPRPRR